MEDINEQIIESLSEIKEDLATIKEMLETKQSSNTTDLMCNEHGVALKQATSKKTGKPYGYHRNEDEQICFGRGYQTKQA